ncbi:ATP-binding protein [Streptomyces sp. NPDC085665]|uniref:ATP-binding protein n=1 Tax=Streptomyces sp. NPDC085665 TaxID=3365735 RepID=UPI0037D19BCD
MDQASQEDRPGAGPLPRPVSLTVEFEGSEPIAEARRLIRSFLTAAHTVHGVSVSERALALAELVVTELVTNTRKYAPGPSLLILEIDGGCVHVAVWDSNTALPAILPPDPTRVGQHGLEIITAFVQTFRIDREPVGNRITAAIPLTDIPQTNPPDREDEETDPAPRRRS